MMRRVRAVYLHPAPVRIWHWLNAACFIALILTGIQMRFAEVLSIIPLEDAIRIHNYVGFLLIADYGLWVAYYCGTGKIRLYFPASWRWSAMADQVRYYLIGFFKGAPNPHHADPEHKFNILQQQVYLLVMLVALPAQLISGLFLWRIQRFKEYIFMLGGIKIIDTVHVLLFFFFIVFLCAHTYLATLGETALTHLQEMFTGYALRSRR